LQAALQRCQSSPKNKFIACEIGFDIDYPLAVLIFEQLNYLLYLIFAIDLSWNQIRNYRVLLQNYIKLTFKEFLELLFG
jgi:hypothetical protein